MNDIFDKTTQSDVEILRVVNSTTLVSTLREKSPLFSQVTFIGKNEFPVGLPPLPAVKDKQRMTHISDAEVTDPLKMKLEIHDIVMHRYNLGIRYESTAEAMAAIASREICIKQIMANYAVSMEHAILYGTQQNKGIVADTQVTMNWVVGGGTPPAKNKFYWSADGFHRTLSLYLETGQAIEHACILAGVKAFANLYLYSQQSDRMTPLVEAHGNGKYTMYGIPIYCMYGMWANDIIFGNFKNICVRMLALSVDSHTEAATINRVLTCYSAFEVGIMNNVGFWKGTVPNHSEYDKAQNPKKP